MDPTSFRLDDETTRMLAELAEHYAFDRVDVIRLAVRQLHKRDLDRIAKADRETIKNILDAVGGNMDEAAKRLQCSRRTLQAWMREVGLPPGRAGRRGKHV